MIAAIAAQFLGLLFSLSSSPNTSFFYSPRILYPELFFNYSK